MKKHKLSLAEIKVMADQIEADEKAIKESKKPTIKLYSDTPFVKAVEEALVKTLEAQPQQAVEQSIPFGDIEEDEEDNYALWVQEGHDEVTAELKSLRLERGIKQVDVARALGVSPTKVCNFEKGKKVTHWDLMAKAYRMYLQTSNGSQDAIDFREDVVTEFIMGSVYQFIETTKDKETLLESLCSLSNHIDEEIVELETELFGKPCEEIVDERTDFHVVSIVDEDMVRIIMKGINMDGYDSQNMDNPRNAFIQFEPLPGKTKQFIALYQANYNKSQDCDEELPDIKGYLYNVYWLDGDTLAIYKNCTEEQARVPFKKCKARFWLDRK